MPRSLDALIKFLLDEIAFSGQQGNTPAHILGFIHKFYQNTEDNTAPSEDDDRPSSKHDGPTIDRAFQEQVWKWLTKHPDVHVGRDGRGNKMSLTAVEAQCTNKPAAAPPMVLEDPLTSSKGLIPEDQQRHVSSKSSLVKSTKTGDALKVYVTEERMWLAICGHPKDLTKVFETEFALLSIIAARGEGGILQGDLVKESGQDKRSVPKRTDSLRDKGYIEKRNIQLRGSKTSRLIYRRSQSSGANELIKPMPVWVGPDGFVQNEAVEFQFLVQKLFAVLKEKLIITRDDLKKELEMTTKWRARVLAKAVRKLEHIGCLSRVKAASEASRKVRLYFFCIKFIHEPSEKDLEAFFAPATNLFDEHAFEEQDPEDEDEALPTMAEPTMRVEGNQLQEIGRVVPQWNPDRSLPNALHNLVHDAGTQGLTNKALRYQSMGAFVRRPLEYLLTRLTGLWRESQPCFLRHLAIVRDKILSGTLPIYVQYSFPNFQARVESGQAFWEAVKTSTTDRKETGKKKSTNNVPGSSDGREVDEFGFPVNYRPASQYKGARATLGQALLAAQPDDLPLSNRDPVLYHEASGVYAVRYEAAGTRTKLRRSVGQDLSMETAASAAPDQSNATKQPSEPLKASFKTIGRPRKFLQGTEKFWRGQFAMARALKNPEKHSLTGSKAGVMSDPAGQSLFAQRPPQFDQTLVRALESELPVPAKPKDIIQEWVDQMLPVLNRSTPGLYITPKGDRNQRSRKHKRASRILICRSTRLGELDLSQRRKIPAVRFIASSAAHTFADLRNEFLREIVHDSEDGDASSSNPTRPQSPVREMNLLRSEPQGIPRYEGASALAGSECGRPTVVHETRGPAQPARGSRQGRPRKNANVMGSERVSSLDENSSSHGRHSLDTLEDQPPFTGSLSLPPPLTTRSALRNEQSAKQVASPLTEAREDVSAVTVNKSSDHVDTESIPFAKPSQISTQIDPAAALQSPARNNSPPDKQMTPTSTSRERSLDNEAPVSATLYEAPNGLEQPPKSPLSQRTKLPPSQRQTTVPGITDGVEELQSPAVDHSRLSSTSIAEETSEPYRLVQELTEDIGDSTNGREEATISDDDQQQGANSPSPDADGQTTLPALRVSQIDSDVEPPRKRSKQEGIGAGSVGVLRRKIVLDLLEACGGTLPYYFKSLLSAFVMVWQRAGQSGKPDIRTLKTTVKSLCQNGSAKQIKFSHRNKKGIMVTKTILAKTDIAISEPVLLETQKRMIEADPRQYVPQGLEVDFDLKEDIEKRMTIPWPNSLEEGAVETSTIPKRVLREQLRETLARARERRQPKDSEARKDDGAQNPQDGTTNHPARLKSIRPKYRRSSGLYKRPKLSMYNYPQPPQHLFSNQSTESLSRFQFRTEISQVPSTFEAMRPSKHLNTNQQALNPSHGRGDVSSASHVRFVNSTPDTLKLERVPVIWKKTRDQQVLPSSLENILLNDRRRAKPNYDKEDDPEHREFEWTVDGVARWEQRSFNLFESKSSDWVFINHRAGNRFQTAPESESRITFDGIIWYDQRGREHTEKRFHALDQDVRPASARDGPPALREQAQEVSSVIRSRTLVANEAPGKRKRASIGLTDPAKRRRRGKSPLTQPQTITDSVGNLIDVSHLIGAKFKRPRGTQHLRTMPEHLIYKLTVTIVVVRTLAGGLEKHVDWSLVMRVFPDEEVQFLKDRWKTLSNKHRRDIDQLSENFQDKFPGAYAKGDVPRINFDDLEGIEWESLVQWGLDNLDKPVIHAIPDLPATRSELDDTVNMKIESSHRPYRELFGYNHSVTIPVKEAAISAVPFAVLLPPSTPATPPRPPHLSDPTDDTSDDALMLAKSWALSTITTPLLTFDSALAHTKLQSLSRAAHSSDALIASALKSLTSDRSIIKNRDKATDAKGRSYELSRVFTDTLDARRTINAHMLKQAVHYKCTVLDPAFRAGQVAKFVPTTVEDGDMIAILNLAAHERILIKIGDDVPRNRWGVDQKSKYKTRSIRKETLYFTVLIEQVPDRYLFDNPLLNGGDDNHNRSTNMLLPTLGTGDRDRIPIWRDIHGGFQQGFWDLAIAAILGILASRAGASSWEITKMMGPALAEWEVECLLEWCEGVGVVMKTGEDDGAGAGAGEGVGEGEGGWTGGWEVREWWWMALECGRLGEK